MKKKIILGGGRNLIFVDWEEFEKTKGSFNARDFVGKVKFRTDPLELQRDLR